MNPMHCLSIGFVRLAVSFSLFSRYASQTVKCVSMKTMDWMKEKHRMNRKIQTQYFAECMKFGNFKSTKYFCEIVSTQFKLSSAGLTQFHSTILSFHFLLHIYFVLFCTQKNKINKLQRSKLHTACASLRPK